MCVYISTYGLDIRIYTYLHDYAYVCLTTDHIQNPVFFTLFKESEANMQGLCVGEPSKASLLVKQWFKILYQTTTVS